MAAMFVEKADNLIYREIDGEVVIITKDGRHIHMLNETATLIWNKSTEKTSISQLIAHMCEEYDVDHETASRDVLDTVKTLAEKDLVRVYEQ